MAKDPPLAFKSYTYPDNEKLEKVSRNIITCEIGVEQIQNSGKIWDFSPYDKPTDPNYYSLRIISGFQNRPGVLNAKTGKTPTNRGVSVEHILEWYDRSYSALFEILELIFYFSQASSIGLYPRERSSLRSLHRVVFRDCGYRHGSECKGCQGSSNKKEGPRQGTKSY